MDLKYANYFMFKENKNQGTLSKAMAISLSKAICRIKQKSFQFLFEKLGVRDQSNVNRQAVPGSWCSDGERPL